MGNSKAGVITFAVIITFIVTDIPKELIALTAAGFLLLNRSIASSDMLKLVDGNLYYSSWDYLSSMPLLPPQVFLSNY